MGMRCDAMPYSHAFKPWLVDDEGCIKDNPFPPIPSTFFLTSHNYLSLTKLFFQLFSTTTNYTYFPSNTSSSQPTTCLSPLGKLDFPQYTRLYDDVIPRDPRLRLSQRYGCDGSSVRIYRVVANEITTNKNKC